MYVYYIPHRLCELNGVNILKEQNLSTLKKMTSILVIDDRDFTYLEPLKQYEYNISQKNDLNMLTDVEAFDVILCDIRGVGKFLESTFEGANLIKQLKKKYPNKTIIAYTANDYDASFQEYLVYADEIVPKGGYDIEDWDSLLTRILKECANPTTQWKKTRKALEEADVQTVDIAKYESDYVKAVKSGKFDSIRKLYCNSDKKGSQIMIELLSSIAVKLLTK
ncbi:MAG: hypothetical protein IJB70_09285 [Clostridia bacterium]|nr:hypothetical protein [Clostridia bacterium]